MTDPKRRYLFCVVDDLGWKTYGSHLKAFLESRIPGEFDFVWAKLSPLLKRVTWQIRYKDKESFSIPIFDPYESFNRQLRTWTSRAEEYQAIFCCTQSISAAFILADPKVPIIQTVDSNRLLYKRDFGARNIEDKRIRSEVEIFKRVAHTISFSSYVRESLVSDYGIPTDKITVLPPPVKISDTKRKTGESKRLKVLFVGNDFVRKGGQLLLKAQTEKLHKVCDLHVVTSLVYRDESVPNTTWHGQVENSYLLHTLLPQVDLLCHPTLRDWSAYVVVEAAAAGVPAIASAVAGIPDLIQNGESGFLCARGNADEIIDKIIQLSENRGFLSRMSESARNVAAQKFDTEMHFNFLLKLMRSAQITD